MTKDKSFSQATLQTLMQAVDCGQLTLDPALVALLRASIASPQNVRYLKLAQQRLAPHLLRMAMQVPNGFGQAPLGDQLYGIIQMGVLESTRGPYGLNPSDFSGNSLIVGNSGSGKTTALFGLCTQASFHVPTWVLCFNREYKQLKMHFQILRARESLRFNPLLPPDGFSIESWTGIMSNILSMSVGLLEASRSLLLRALTQLYLLYDPLKTGQWPSLWNLHAFLKSEKVHIMSRQASYSGTLLNRLEALLTLSCFDCSKGHSLIKLRKQNIIWELDGLSLECTRFLVSSMLLWLFHERLASGQLETGLRHLICMDEAQILLDRSQEKRWAEGVPLMASYISQVRKTGTALVLAAQSPSQLLTSALQNCSRRFIFRIGSGRDLAEIKSDLSLNQDQTRLLGQLPVGVCLIKDPRHPEPFICRIGGSS